MPKPRFSQLVHEKEKETPLALSHSTWMVMNDTTGEGQFGMTKYEGPTAPAPLVLLKKTVQNLAI